jgi:lipopolysaccharide export system protein LptA
MVIPYPAENSNPHGARYPHKAACFRFICAGLFVGLLMISQSFAKDTIIITSKKTAVIDKTRGTAVWRDNVVVVRKSTGSKLMTNLFSVARDTISERLIWAEASGNVKANYYRSPADDHEKSLNITPDLQPAPHSIITCDQATYSRKSALAELVGSVDIQSQDFELQAEKIRYDYQIERGKITAKVGQKVQFVFYKKELSDDQPPSDMGLTRQKISGSAKEILVNRLSRKIVLQGGVFIIDHSDQSQFKADRTDLFFDEQDEIETAVANGNFSMNQPGRISRSDRAKFDYDREEVTLTGNAYVKEEENKVEVTSDRINMYIKVNQGIIRGVDDVPVKMEIEID